MGSFVLTDASVTINSVDLSDHVLSCTLDYSGDLQEETAMGDGTRKRLSGLKDWSLSVEFKQDFAASKVDATLFALIGGAAVPIIVIPVNDTVSATNPSFSGNAVLESYPPIGNAIGELAQTTAVFQAAGDLSRNVT